MRFGSLFSGIEAASVAWGPLGWKCQWVAEIEKFPSAVLAHHYPDVPNLGDVTKVDWEKISATRPVDAIVFGSPCQSFSVAGKRLGLDDPRGNLALYALSVVDRLRPDWFVFENVPGLLSSGGGRDFGAFLGTVGDIGYQCAWRVLDAQHFGLAQRRARVFVVGHLGDWRRAAAVLFERESLRWHPAPRRQAGEGVANSLTERPDRGGGNSEGQRLIAPTLPSRGKGGGRLGTDFDCDGGLITGTLDTRSAAHMSGMKNEADFLVAPEISMCLNAGGMGRQDSESETLIAHSLRADGFDASEDGTGRGTPIVPIDLRQASRGEKITNNRAHGSGGAPGHGIGNAGDPAFTVSERGQAIAFTAKDRGADAGEIAPTLRGGGHDKSHANGGVMPAVAFEWQRGATQNLEMLEEQAPALIKSQTPAIQATSAVRRLTPRECERLQGFPDDYTLVPYRGKPASDGPRYKALGNSMAVPVMAWIGRRIALVQSLSRPEAA